MQEIENEILTVENPENFTGFNQEEQTKQQQKLYNDLIESKMLFTKVGRKLLGIKLNPYKRESKKIGRNEICPLCSSGLKYKKCCGKF